MSISRELILLCEAAAPTATTTNPSAPGNKVVARTADGKEITKEEAETAAATINALENSGKLAQSVNIVDLDKKISEITK